MKLLVTGNNRSLTWAAPRVTIPRLNNTLPQSDFYIKNVKRAFGNSIFTHALNVQRLLKAFTQISTPLQSLGKNV